MSLAQDRALAATWATWLTAVEDEGANLTAWEETFIESLKERLDKYGSLKLSEKQAEQLERIYTERTP